MIAYHPTALTATLSLEVAAVRSVHPRKCPVCGRGHLQVETRTERLVGIPRPRSTVRCTECRSLLRQVGNRTWRYAVDPFESPALYARYNGRSIDEETLKALRTTPSTPEVRPPTKPPTFVDDEET